MPAVPAPGIVQLNGIMTLADEKVENTFHYRVSGTVTRAILEAMANTYVSWWSAYAGLYGTSVGLILVYVRDLSSSSGQTLDFVPTSTTDGTRTSPLLPNNVTIAIKRETGLAGRSNRGRVYWVGITQDMLSSPNQMVLGTAASLAAALDNLRTSQASANSATEVILHKASGTGTDVIGYVPADQTLDSQRRRLPGHNRHH